MPRKKIIAGNWKMNKSLIEAQALVNAIINGCGEENSVTKIFFPPFLFIEKLAGLCEEKKDFFVGAQNCHQLESGAYTGEVSAKAIASCGAKYVLIGHSERRIYFHESSEELRQKIEQALKNNLIPVYCVGEKLNERKSNAYFHAVKKQIEEVVFHLTEEQIKNTILAYEPVWAIGTGETATPEQAQEMHAFIRLAVAEKFGQTIAGQTNILYGGSCNAGNAKELFSCPDVDGGLIGGASLKAEEFLSIINSF
ncbi:MAG TPA: triose-phosphate isomerase [Bacteroidia bacterium]|jgi:triosephosphate isomerase|nr:triose-phosphate isomerase [Bacteroidia bacterium]